jgi:hypothetical protein
MDRKKLESKRRKKVQERSPAVVRKMSNTQRAYTVDDVYCRCCTSTVQGAEVACLLAL